MKILKIKVKDIKIPKSFPYKDYTSKIGKHKFEANLYEDNSGQLLVYIKKNMIMCKEDAKLDDWIDGAREKCEFYHNLVDFLMEVKYIHNQEKK
jgi:hypothetical protein